MRPLCPQCSRQYELVPYAKGCLVVPPCGHARCYECARKKRLPTCSPDCKEIIRTSSLAFVTFDYIDLNDDDWVVKLISARHRSQSLDTVTLEDSCGMLKEERSGLSLSLRSFSFGSTFQIAVEALVFNTSEVEKEEDKLLSEIAMETRRLEELELEIQTAKSQVKWRKEAMDDQCDLL